MKKEWESGRVGEWESGRVGEWESGRVGEGREGREGKEGKEGKEEGRMCYYRKLSMGHLHRKTETPPLLPLSHSSSGHADLKHVLVKRAQLITYSCIS